MSGSLDGKGRVVNIFFVKFFLAVNIEITLPEDKDPNEKKKVIEVWENAKHYVAKLILQNYGNKNFILGQSLGGISTVF